MHQLPIERVRALGCRPAAPDARSHLESRHLQGFWVPVDVDVLDRTLLPAVDSPNPNGLQADDLVDALRTLFASPRATGIEFTIYDPDLDPTGTYGDRLAGILVDALSPT
ncbi:MAG: arginase family protein [Thermoplasmata archaeon]|nr:arginase family protein [Thermoplasmata archaeon]